MRIVMLGAPGAGKGTQAIQIAAKYQVPHISTGDIFRANIKNGTPLGVKAKSYMDQGLLVPDELTVMLLLDRVAKEDCKYGYVLDGFPRTLEQAVALEEALSKLGQSIDLCINVDIADAQIVERMSGRRACSGCGATYHLVYVPPSKEGVCDACNKPLILRDDDKPETVLHRLQVYHDQTEPLVTFYEARGVLRTVDGTQEVQKVFEDILIYTEKFTSEPSFAGCR
jgi:adenylate kinase